MQQGMSIYSIMINNIFAQDERFNQDIDIQTGYRTHSLVCMPVCNYDGEVIGVAQIINKRGGSNNHEFTETDLKVCIIYALINILSMVHKNWH